ncbi:hypothetical protein HDV02_004614 [Globomyces sp. JEL0801]|nr:hypothetical protein HDV02_004614 [Globomyces sp. JEL0801]
MWDCEKCTFINFNTDAKECEMCFSSKYQVGSIQNPIVLDDEKVRTDNHFKRRKMDDSKTVTINEECFDQLIPNYNGTVVMTKVHNSKSKFTFKNLVEKSKLKKAFFSAFCIDDDWLFNQLPNDISVCIARPKPNDVESNVTNITITPKISFVFPTLKPMQYGCMHVKLMLLWYPEFLRVVVPSANLTEYCWNTIENDFRKADSSRELNEFGTDLKNLLVDMKVPSLVVGALNGYDFSNALGKLIVSKPGWHKQSQLELFGHLRLKRVLSTLGLNLTNSMLTLQSSSMGGLNKKWCMEMCKSLTNTAEETNRINVLFPTEETVLKSFIGPENAETICFQSKYWKSSFPKEYLRDCKSKCNGALMHAKTILVHQSRYLHDIVDRGIQFIPTGDQDAHGSHNASQAAWGLRCIVRQEDCLKIHNWELGIVLKFRAGGSFQIPYQYPPPEYKSTDKPWV